MAEEKRMWVLCDEALEAAGVKGIKERSALISRLDPPVAKALIWHHQRNKTQRFTPRTDARINQDRCNIEAQLAAQKGRS